MKTATELFKGADDIARFLRTLEGLQTLEPMLRDAAMLLQATDEARRAHGAAIAERDAAIAARDAIATERDTLRIDRDKLLGEVATLTAKRDALRADLAALRARVSV